MCVAYSQHNATKGEAPLSNQDVEREMRELRVRLEVMEVVERRAPDIGYISDAERGEAMGENFFGEATEEDVLEECLLRAVARLGGRAKIEVPMYEGNLDVEEMLDWIRSMDKNLDYEEFDEEKNVKQVVTRIK
jgi:hypothetical protein